MEMRYIIEVLAALTMIGGAGIILQGVLQGKLAFSSRTVQVLAIVFGLPAIIILSLERTIGSEAASAVIGTVIGFALSSMTRNE